MNQNIGTNSSSLMNNNNNNNNNNNRRGPNPLTRAYESNGPDVKIRGTAQQVLDRYVGPTLDGSLLYPGRLDAGEVGVLHVHDHQRRFLDGDGDLPAAAAIAPMFQGRVEEGVLYCVRAALQSEFEL